jgi:hypothetical protein
MASLLLALAFLHDQCAQMLARRFQHQRGHILPPLVGDGLTHVKVSRSTIPHSRSAPHNWCTCLGITVITTTP